MGGDIGGADGVKAANGSHHELPSGNVVRGCLKVKTNLEVPEKSGNWGKFVSRW